MKAQEGFQEIYSGMSLNEVQRAADQLFGQTNGFAGSQDNAFIFALIANLAARTKEIHASDL